MVRKLFSLQFAALNKLLMEWTEWLWIYQHLTPALLLSSLCRKEPIHVLNHFFVYSGLQNYLIISYESIYEVVLWICTIRCLCYNRAHIIIQRQSLECSLSEFKMKICLSHLVTYFLVCSDTTWKLAWFCGYWEQSTV